MKKFLAMLMTCPEQDACAVCRTCKLIKDGAFSDVIFYPKKGDSMTSEEVNELIEESYLKPIEGDKKIFIVNRAESINHVAQNKLLKTLEEPPESVHIILGATSEFSLLPTIKSRVKKLEIPFFNKQTLKDALKNECEDELKLESAIACADGTVGKVLSLYGDQNFVKIQELCVGVLVNMQSSKDVLLYSNKITASGVALNEFLSVMQLFLRDILTVCENRQDLALNQTVNQLKNVKGFKTGSVLHAIESVTEASKRLKFNANATMLIEWLLFQILEGKYKWQKL
jgi:DNA polymerase-3 subunit delta'